ncbi:MAG: DNA adenine methylase [Gammaproteobacteria bacterium]|nr:DNA adenine methylase [Gammaproteobacteria bacterium]
MDAWRSPLQYPGGKGRAVAVLFKRIPRRTTRLVSPFFGSGKVELFCAASGILVTAGDSFEPLANFWRYALDDSGQLADQVETHYPMTKQGFYELRNSFDGIVGGLERAAAFFALNRASFGGLTLSGGYNPNKERFNRASIDRLRFLQADNVTVSCADWRDTLARRPDDFAYCDPPYYNFGGLYGKRQECWPVSEHEALAESLKRRKAPWLLSYGDCPEIRDLYQDCIVEREEWAYSMKIGRCENYTESNELLIRPPMSASDADIAGSDRNLKQAPMGQSAMSGSSRT